MKVLPATQVTTLMLDWSLKNVQLKPSALQHLLEEGSKIETLSLRSNSLGEKEILALTDTVVAGNTTLTVLDLSNNILGDEAAAPLASILSQPTSVLTSLSLNSCGLADGFSSALAAQLADRVYNEEEAAAAEVLKAAAEEVELRNQNLKKGAAPEPVPMVPVLTTDADGNMRGPANRILKEIMLENNQLTLTGVQELTSAIKENQVIAVAYLKHNNVQIAEEELVSTRRVVGHAICSLCSWRHALALVIMPLPAAALALVVMPLPLLL